MVLACPHCRAWFDEEAFAAALAVHGVKVVAGKAADAWKVSIKAYDSQSAVNALISFLRKKRARQHIKYVLAALVLQGCCSPLHPACFTGRAVGWWPAVSLPALRSLECGINGCFCSCPTSTLPLPTAAPLPTPCLPGRIDCPAFRLPGDLMKRHKALLMDAAAALRPSPRFQALIDGRRQEVEAKTGSSSYNLLHIRVEKDWLGLCDWWQNPEEGRDNCMNNTVTVGKQLRINGFARQVRGQAGGRR